MMRSSTRSGQSRIAVHVLGLKRVSTSEVVLGTQTKTVACFLDAVVYGQPRVFEPPVVVAVVYG